MWGAPRLRGGEWQFRGPPIAARPNICNAYSWTCRGSVAWWRGIPNDVRGRLLEVCVAVLLQEEVRRPSCFGSFLTDIRAQGNPCAVECLHSDNGTEFTKQGFVTLLDRHGI